MKDCRGSYTGTTDATELLGDASLLYECLIRQAHGDLNPKEAQLVLAAHIDNGIDKLKRAKNIQDLISYS